MDQTLEYVQKHWAWAVAVASIVFAGIYLAINLYVSKRRAQRAFSYRVLIDEPLITMSEHASGSKLRISYADRPVRNLRLVNVELRNSGALPLEKGDFAEPVTICFPNGTELLDPAVVRTWPDGLKAEISGLGNVITLAPTLINQKEWLVIKVLVPSSLPVKVTVRGRIKGISEIAHYRPAIKNIPGNLLLSLQMVAGLCLISLSPAPNKSAYATIMVLGFVSIAIAMCLLYYTPTKKTGKRDSEPLEAPIGDLKATNSRAARALRPQNPPVDNDKV